MGFFRFWIKVAGALRYNKLLMACKVDVLVAIESGTLANMFLAPTAALCQRFGAANWVTRLHFT